MHHSLELQKGLYFENIASYAFTDNFFLTPPLNGQKNDRILLLTNQQVVLIGSINPLTL